MFRLEAWVYPRWYSEEGKWYFTWAVSISKQNQQIKASNLCLGTSGILRDTFFFFSPSGSKCLEQIWPTTTRAIWSSFPLFNTLLQGLSCVIISQGSLTATSFPPWPLSSRSIHKFFYRPVFYSPPRPALPASLDCSVFLSHAGVFLSLHLCSQAFLISCTDPTASPTPKFPQHILCASCSPGLLCFTVMCLPVWLSIYTAKSLTLVASNASS